MTYTCPCAHVCVHMCVRISDGELVSGIHKVLAQINRRNADNPEKKWARHGCLRLRTAHTYTRTKAFNFTSHQRNASPAQHGAATHPQDDADQCRQRCGLCPRQKHTLVRPTATRPLLGTARVPTEAAARRCAGAGDGVRDLTPAGAAHEGTKGVSPSLRGTNQPVLRTAGRQGQPAGCRLGGPGTPERADACACTSVGTPRTSSCSAGTLHFQREPQTPPGQQARLSGIHRAGAEAATRPLEPTSRPRGPERGTCVSAVTAHALTQGRC